MDLGLRQRQHTPSRTGWAIGKQGPNPVADTTGRGADDADCTDPVRSAQWREHCTLYWVPTLDEIKHFPARFGWRMEGVAIDQLTLKRGEETLAQRVVEAITDGTHRWTHHDPVHS